MKIVEKNSSRYTVKSMYVYNGCIYNQQSDWSDLLEEIDPADEK